MTGKENSREFRFSDQDFQLVRKMIYEHAGIFLAENKLELVYSRLSRRLRETGCRDFAEYFARLEQNDKREWEAFANSLTTNLTSFFREGHHFGILAEFLRQLGGKHNIALWCAACSTGEEAYSMAITAIETFNSLAPPVNIIATDIDTNVLEVARKGIYSSDSIKKLDPGQLKYFTASREGEGGERFTVRPELKRIITFRKLNLLDTQWPIRPPLHAIFCRNVMIYFDKETRFSILNKFAPLLHNDGLLFAGHAESLFNARALFTSRGNTVYELSPDFKAARLSAGQGGKDA